MSNATKYHAWAIFKVLDWSEHGHQLGWVHTKNQWATHIPKHDTINMDEMKWSINITHKRKLQTVKYQRPESSLTDRTPPHWDPMGSEPSYKSFTKCIQKAFHYIVFW